MSDMSNKNIGSLVISAEVISKIASVAARDVEGVKDVVAKPNDIKSAFSRESSSKAVRVVSNESGIAIDIYVCLKLGARIPDVSEAVQVKVKDAVQNMTGKVVSKVNVNIADIDIADEPASTAAQE